MKKKLKSLWPVMSRALFGIFISLVRWLRGIIGTSRQECSSMQWPCSDHCPIVQPEHYRSGLAQAGEDLPKVPGDLGWSLPQDPSAIGSQDEPARHVMRLDRSDMPIDAVVSRLLAGGCHLDKVIPWLVFLPNVRAMATPLAGCSVERGVNVGIT